MTNGYPSSENRTFPREGWRPRILAILVLLMAVGSSSSASSAAREFYSGLLRDGQLSLARGDHENAVVELELACFGLLDEPRELATGLTALAVAQAKTNDRESFEKTFRRVLEVEERFAGYSEASMPAETRELFEGFAKAFVPRGYLITSDTFAHLAAKLAEPENSKEQRREKKRRKRARSQTAEVPPPETIPTTAAALPTSRAVEEDLESATLTEQSVELGSTEDVETIDVLNGGEGHGEAATPTAGTVDKTQVGPESGFSQTEARDAIARAREMLRTARTAEDLQAAMSIVRPIADSDPTLASAQHVVAEIAYMGSNWPLVTTYYERGGVSSRAELEFYAAVAYFESGNHEQAVRVLQEALPRLARDAYVDQYVERILGHSGSSR